MASRFHSNLHQRSDPRDALFENYQPTAGGSAGKARRSPAPPGEMRGARASSMSGSVGYDTGPRWNGWADVGQSGGAVGFRTATPNKQGQYSDAVLSSLESQNDSQVEGIIGKVRQLKSMTMAIGDEIRDSSALAEKMNEGFEGTRIRLRGTMSRMLVMAKKTGVGWKAWVAFFSTVILLFWWVRFMR